MMLTPGGAVLVGAIAAVLSVCGFRFGHDGDGVMVVLMATMKYDVHAANYHELQFSYVQPFLKMAVIKLSNYQG